MEYSESSLAKLVMADARQLSERAEVEGVTAYAQRPRQRARPNQRFLQSTIRSVETANRRVEEDAMWGARREQLLREMGEAAPAEPSQPAAPDCREGLRNSSHAGLAAGDRPADEEIGRLLAGTTRRGRGGTGSLMDLAGPYLAVAAEEAEAEVGVADDVAAKPSAGPARPAWLEDGGGGTSASSESEGSRQARRSAGKRKRKEKKQKKERKEKKEKNRKREKQASKSKDTKRRRRTSSPS